MMPPAPPRFSITTGWPRLSCSAGTKLRAAISVPPPGAAGTMRWIGFVGYCAAAGGMAKGAASSTRERIAIGLVIARRRTNPRLPKKKARPAERTSYALNSSGDYPQAGPGSSPPDPRDRPADSGAGRRIRAEPLHHRSGERRRHRQSLSGPRDCAGHELPRRAMAGARRARRRGAAGASALRARAEARDDGCRHRRGHRLLLLAYGATRGRERYGVRGGHTARDDEAPRAADVAARRR